MECPSLEDFRARFNEFESIPDAKVEMFLSDACNFFDYELFDTLECWESVILYYAAHLLTLSLRAAQDANNGIVPPSPAGAITASSAGGLSVSYSITAGRTTQESWLQSTPYGNFVLNLTSTCININRVATPNFSC